jgi:type IV fimbrial biogenesis protein FimT
MRNLHSNRSRAGYSLMELLVVLVLVGILASLAGPAMGEYIGRLKTRRALDQITADLAYARMAAVRSGRRAVMRFQGPSDYSIEVVGDPTVPVRSVRLGSDYAGVVITPPGTTLEFNSRGLLVSALAREYLVVSLGSMRDSLILTPAGRVYRDF